MSRVARALPVLVAALLAVPAPVRAQETALVGLAANTGYDELGRAAGLGARLTLVGPGLEVTAGWLRDQGTRTGIPCAGLLPPDPTRCVEQEVEVSGTLTTLAVTRPITVARWGPRLAVVPVAGAAAARAEQVGGTTGASVSSGRWLARAGLGLDLRGDLAREGRVGYSVRLYGGRLFSGGSTCVDCYEAFDASGREVRLEAGVAYRW